MSVAAAGGTFGTCGVNHCHNSGQSTAALSAYTWNTVLGGGTNSCTECHGTDSATLTTQSHPKHNAVAELRALPRGGDGEHAHQRVDQPAGDPGGRRTAAATPSVALNGGTFGTCVGPATGCHMGSVTPNWNGGTTNCSTCHGYPPSVGTNHLDANRTGYANTDTTFLAAHGQCATCHGVAGNTIYPTAPTGFGTPLDKTPTGDAYVIGTMHGDGSVQMNGAGGANAPYTENAGYNQTTWACDNAGCHSNAVKFNASTSSALVELREFGAGTCDGCHGGGTVGANASNYWPDDSTANAENTAKRHPLHMTRLALARYNENITQLLTDNVNGTSSVKQVELCSYCHTSPGTDGDHGSAANLPAEVNTFYTLWLPKTVDNGVWATAGGGTCATTNCHNNKTTTNTAGIDFSWNGNTTTNTTACIMCHTDITERRQPHGSDAPGAPDDVDGRRERLLRLPRGDDLGDAGDGAGGGTHQRHLRGRRRGELHVHAAPTRRSAPAGSTSATTTGRARRW